jgi:membrane protein
MAENTNGNKISKFSQFKKGLSILIEKIKDFLNSVYLGEKTYNNITNKLINVVKVFIVSTRKFMEDDCLTKASSIAYTIMVSLIPTLTVVLTIYSIFSGVAGQKDELFRQISVFMQDHNLKLNIDPIFSAISELIGNAGKIGGIGAAIMIFSATAMLRSLEKSLNDIYKVQKQRSIFMKLVFYWAALTLGPIMIVAATTVASQLSEVLSSPNYNSAHISENHIWIAGSKSSLGKASVSDMKFKNVTVENIDFDNQKVFDYDRNENALTLSNDEKMDPLEFTKIKYTDVQFIENKGWAIAQDGVMLFTEDGGKKWQLRKLGKFTLNDIYMISPVDGYIVGNSGIMLATADGGNSWNIISIANLDSNLSTITFKGTKGIITASRGKILTTEDSGKNWIIETIEETKKSDRYSNINNSFILDNNDILLIGDEGLILKSKNGGKTWKKNRFKQSNYFTIYFFDGQKGVIAGDKGTMIFTDDGGENWYKKSLPTQKVNKILYVNKKLWAIGDTGMIMSSVDSGQKWRGFEGKSFIAFLINFLAPFAFIWLLFLLVYMSLPNTKVPFKQAAIGAAFTGALWVMFILLFIVYTKAFAKGTFAIYGALVAIPLFLLMIYTSSLIILYGAEVSYTLMHPGSYKNLKKVFKDKTDLHIFFGLNVLIEIYKKFEQGNGSTELKEIVKAASHEESQVDFFLDLFIENNLISQNTEGHYYPTKSSEVIKVADVIELIHSISFMIPSTVKKSNLKSWLSEIFSKLEKNRKQIIGDLSLKDLVIKS